MSVILQIGNFTVSQDWSGQLRILITNSGDENVKNVRLKVVDSEVFTSLNILAGGGTWQTCLNDFQSWNTRFYTAEEGGSVGFLLPSGTSYWVDFKPTIKVDAPIQENNLVCYWQYIVY